LPAHNARFAVVPAGEGLAFTPRSRRVRPHFVKARVKVRVYPGPCLSRRHALFHRPRCIGRYDENGTIRDGKSAA
jgi:hypothetical protein